MSGVSLMMKEEVKTNDAAALLISAALVEAIALVSEGIVVCDREGEIIYQNDLGCSWMDGSLGGPTASAALRDVLGTAINGQPTTRSIEVLGPPRNSMTITGLPVKTETASGAVAVIEDTTERRHLEAVRRDFLANVSHELKTPIGALGLLSETILVEKDPEVTRRLAQRMQDETSRVAQVIDDLLHLSRLESLHPVPAEILNAKAIVDQATSRVRYTAEHRSITIEVLGDGNASVYGGQRELISAVHHLLENALKYSDDNSSIEIVIESDGNLTEIQVRDHGMGIAAQYLDRIFERFYRVDDARTRSSGGTGLGLSIVRHVVQNHGGEVRVTSREGYGSTFTLMLAAGPSAATERMVVEGGRDG